jgi:hypothetical protein
MPAITIGAHFKYPEAFIKYFLECIKAYGSRKTRFVTEFEILLLFDGNPSKPYEQSIKTDEIKVVFS